MKSLFNDKEKEYLIKNMEGHWARELTEMFNKEFDKNVSMKQIQVWRENHKLKNNVYEVFNKEEINFLKEVCIKNLVEDVIILFEEKFNKNITKNQVYAFKRKHNIKSGIDCKFKKGVIQYKYKPVGTETITYEKGRKIVYVKVDENNWERKHKYIYEKHNGKVPKDSVIIFLDGNRNNFDIDNLALITRHESNIMAGERIYFKSKELNKVAIDIAKLKSKAKQLERS